VAAVDDSGASVTVCVTTYRRPVLLARMLASIAELDPPAPGWHRTPTVVVDNDAAGSARETVAAWEAEGNPVRYVVEPEPGISAARNRALAEAGGAFVAFADDDDRLDRAWLAELTRTQTETGADAVVGRARYEFEEGVPEIVRSSGTFHERDLPQGAPLHSVSAGMLLLRRALPFNPAFDPRFGLIGGEDDAFGRRLLAAGGTVVHAPGAVTRVWVPADRATPRALLRRWTREGSAMLLIDLTLADSRRGRALVRLRGMAGGLAKLVVGACRIPVRAARGGRPAALGAASTPFNGAGMLSAAIGRPVAGYRRPRRSR
jgi:glycosyltransferase involved in cell wall biosynthesis